MAAMWVLLPLVTAMAALAAGSAPSPDFLPATYLTMRAANIMKQRAQLDSDLQAGARAAAALAAAPRYKLPTMKPSIGQPRYVDLSRTGPRPQAATASVPGGVNFDTTGR